MCPARSGTSSSRPDQRVIVSEEGNAFRYGVFLLILVVWV